MNYYEGKLFRDENGKVYFNDVDGEGFTEIVMGSSSSTPTDSSSYKVYSALLNQSGENDPVATILENTLEGDINWTRTGAGNYSATRTEGSFDKSNTFVLTGQSLVGNRPIFSTYCNAGAIQLQCYSITEGSQEDNDLDGLPVEIRVYT